ncbi:MAG: septum formation inhibitor Maf [Eubacterium sp.]|nr:septum formation inhibitor Maf [Eubacterium sp.]MBQ9022736.1 septum formation inhibitor Maf [Eubacterium sp.]
MNSKKIILASASPRRYELLTQLGLTFTVEPAQGEEKIQDHIPPEEIVKRLAYAKADEIRKRHIKEDLSDNSTLIIGADTIVVKDGRILGKPADEADAYAMLMSLSGSTHQVYTGVALISAEWEVQFCEKTDVTFYPMTKQEITEYIQTGEPMDKAGAYGIQGIGGRFVKEIHGDYNNVVGLPIARLYHVLKEI